MREMSFTVTFTDEDLAVLGLDPAKVSDKKMKELVGLIEQIFHEDYLQQVITKKAIREVDWSETISSTHKEI